MTERLLCTGPSRGPEALWASRRRAAAGRINVMNLRLPRPLWAWVQLVCALVSAAGCAPGVGELCECFPCTAAVNLRVLDAVNGAPLEDFVLEAIVNGSLRGVPEGCRPEERNGNTCSFGLETGIYHLVVAAPGYATREALVRLAEPGSGGEQCCRICLLSEETTVRLDRL